MLICESCNGLGFYSGAYNNVLCSACSGAGCISLGHESAAKWQRKVAEARLRGEREGWYERVGTTFRRMRSEEAKAV
jgi:hypothetical protein